MSEKIDDQTRTAIAESMPSALEHAISRYAQFIKGDIDEKNTKKYSGYFSASKVGITHIELLLKVSRALGLPGIHTGSDSDQLRLHAVMQEAMAHAVKDREMYEEGDIADL